MVRAASIAILALAALATPAAADFRGIPDLTAAAAATAPASARSSGGKAACSLGTPSAVELRPPSGAVDGNGNPIPAYPMNADITVGYIQNQPKPPLLNHLTTTFDCVDSRYVSFFGCWMNLRGRRPACAP